jgi:DNA-binding MarR family transcriptional regulator
MPTAVEIPITLNPSQIASVVSQATAHDPNRSPLLAALNDLNLAIDRSKTSPQMVGLARTFQRGMHVLMAFPGDGSRRRVLEVSRIVGLSPSTVRRYAAALEELGLLEHDRKARQYRRVLLAT